MKKMNSSVIGKSQLYGVHVGNVPCCTSSEELKALFNGAGNVIEVYIPVHLSSEIKYTFAFVRYVTDVEAFNAIKLFDGILLQGSKIDVTLSLRTQELMSCKQEKKGDQIYWGYSKSIVRKSMPRLERNRFSVLASDERLIHQKLKGSIKCLSIDPKYTQEILELQHPQDIQLFMADLKDVIVKLSNVPYGVGVDAINFKGEAVTQNDLKDIIIQYYSTNDRKNPFKEIDIDLSGGKISKRFLTYFC